MKIEFYQFKSLQDTTLDLSDMSVIVGNNGAGKSSVCEGMTILMNGYNPHITRWSEKAFFGTHEWAIRCTGNEKRHEVIFEGKQSSPSWVVDGRAGGKKTYLATMPFRAFWIESDHVRVILGDPSNRRNFLDEMLSYASPLYAETQKKYHTIIATRNKVIQNIYDKNAHENELDTWDLLFAEETHKIREERHRFFSWLEEQKNTSLHLPGETRIQLVERHPVERNVGALVHLLKEYRKRDLAVGHTTLGPHLDEILFQIHIGGNWHTSKQILSRGENKIFLYAFIRQLGDYVKECSGKKPFFLLDDALSELDEDHVHVLCGLFKNIPTLITTQPNHQVGLTLDHVLHLLS